ncbi:S26 family signal peptidase [Haploplasma axanthum]|uniref:Signal peptidase I W n=1 Tax=Haploplasma axanthum TaxID=29552 RepID=A0A449BDV5_HAPAX|nr:S26 family signal peptidase [Haploplasma axanthum]VEU80626.1 Signal peptidase I W [Haploplasma axanthum]
MKENKKSNGSKIISVIGNVIFYTFILVLLLFSIVNLSAKKEDDVPTLFGRGFVTVLSDSMNGDKKDSFKEGALVFVKDLNDDDKKNLKVGDVVVFWGQLSIDDPKLQAHIIHRIIKIEGNNITTQGDSLRNANTTETNDISRIKALATGHVEGLGKPINYLRTSTGFALFILLPLFILLIVQITILVVNVVNRNKERLRIDHEAEKARLKEEILKELKEKQ